MKPSRKIIAGSLAGAVTTILVWVLGEFAGVQIPAEVAAATTTLFTFLVSYLVTER